MSLTYLSLFLQFAYKLSKTNSEVKNQVQMHSVGAWVVVPPLQQPWVCVCVCAGGVVVFSSMFFLVYLNKVWYVCLCGYVCVYTHTKTHTHTSTQHTHTHTLVMLGFVLLAFLILLVWLLFGSCCRFSSHLLASTSSFLIPTPQPNCLALVWLLL